MKSEKDIEMLCGKGCPFTVPEGYFENLTAQVMSNLPETGKVVEMHTKKHIHWMPWASAAAACVAAVVVITHYTSDNSCKDMQAEATVVYDEQYQSDMMEYAMVDGSDVYTYLAGEY